MKESYTGENKVRYVRGIFSAISPYYDFINSLLTLRHDRSWRKYAVREACLADKGLVLDIATGTAELALHLSNQNRSATIIGVDFCPEMLAQARAKLEKSRNSDRIHLALGDALNLPFPDNTFNTVTIGFGLRNVADLPMAFREMARVTKPDGRIITLELTRPPTRLVRIMYTFSLFRIVSFIGRLISGNREAYTYLPKSIVAFPSPEEIAQMMMRAGLKDVKIHRLTFGAATVHTGIK